MQSTLTKKQVKFFKATYETGGRVEHIIAEVRYDDQCGNGHNTFSVTAGIYTRDRQPGEESVEIEHNGEKVRLWLNGCGCIHEQIAKRLPQLAPFIKWHLCSSDGPLHYIANVLHFASDRDCWGKRAGEPCHFEYGIRFSDLPLTFRIPERFWDWLQEQPTRGFEVVEFQHPDDAKTHGTKLGPKYTFAGFGSKWHECPFDDKIAAEEFADAFRFNAEFVQVPVGFSEGKARELDHARSSAIWPEATDEELTSPDLKERLEARLPALMAEFRAAVESLGFTF